jgi:hypothetical protein
MHHAQENAESKGSNIWLYMNKNMPIKQTVQETQNYRHVMRTISNDFEQHPKETNCTPFVILMGAFQWDIEDSKAEPYVCTQVRATKQHTSVC